ncbi:hypothetical protein Tco_0698796, partial [Tanacetum coccineum]
TDSTKVSTDRQGEGTADQNEGKNATQTAPTTTSTPTPTIFGDDETIAQVLITMSQNKQKEKEKGVEIRNVEDTERPRPTSTRSVLTLKPLPKIDLKDKGKKMIDEEGESDTESDDISKAEKKFKMLVKDEEVARKARINADKILAEELQKEEREKFTIEQRAKFLHDTIAAQRKFLALQRSEAIRNKPPTRNQLRNQMITYLKHDEIQIKEMNEESKDHEKKRLKKRVVNEEDTTKIMMESSTKENDQGDFWNNQQEWEIVKWRLYEACGVCILELKDGTVIYMLVERKYPLSKKLLQQMLDLRLLHYNWQDSLSNSLMRSNVENGNEKELAIPEQTTTSKGISNPLIAAKDVNIIKDQDQDLTECLDTSSKSLRRVNEGHRVVPDMSKPLPLGGPPGDKRRKSALSISKLKAAQYLDFGLEELVPSLWIESEREYDISVAYGISHWWFKRKEFYITRHSASSDRSTVRSHMRILSVVSLKTYERYGYTFLKEYKISEADFKNLHSNDFKDLYLLHLQGQLNHLSSADKVHLFNTVNLWIRNIVIRKRVEDLQLGIESYQTKLNLTQPDWDASDFLFKEDYTIVSKPRAVIYRDRNDQKKMMRETEVHKFSDGTLNRILDKLDHMVKDFKLFKFNPGMEIRIWSEVDRRRSKEFMEVIERRLKIRIIFKSLESFVGGRLRDVDYILIQRTE